MFGIKGSSNDKFYLKSDPLWEMKWPTDKPSNQLVAGPKLVPSYAYNGSDWFQVWGLVIGSGPVEKGGPIVSLPARLFGAESGQPALKSQRFIAQAEFFFDCTSAWLSVECNEGSAATYQMNWRARLRRVHDINVVGDALEVLLNNLLNSEPSEKWADHLLERASKYLSPLKSEAIREGTADALRDDVQKIMNHRVLTGDHASHELLH
jgi:hypothetical protein